MSSHPSADPHDQAETEAVVTVAAEGLLRTVSDAAERAGARGGVRVEWCPTVAAAVEVLREAARRRRGVPVLGLVRGLDAGPKLTAATLELLSHPSLRDLNIAVPTIEDPAARDAVWARLRAVRAEERHQLIEVDGRSALDGIPAPSDPWAAEAAAVAGVLAGRMAAAGRRWREDLER
jgi:hypothetical protein